MNNEDVEYVQITVRFIYNLVFKVVPFSTIYLWL